MALHKEIEFENDICHHLVVNGWAVCRGRMTWRQCRYDLFDRLRKLMDEHGTLHVLHVGLEMMSAQGFLVSGPDVSRASRVV